MNLEGEITLTRTLVGHEIWESPEPFDRRSAFVHLLLVANNRPGLPIIRGRARTMRPGQVGHSMQALAEQWGWSRGKVKRFLEWLQERGTIRLSTEQGDDDTVIQIVNYDLWNCKTNGDGQGNGHAADMRRTCRGHAADTEGEREREREQQQSGKTEKRVEFGDVPSAEEILDVVSSYGWTLDDAEDWRLQKINDPKYGFAKLLDWRAEVLLYARRLDGPPPRPVLAGKNGAKNGGAVSASVSAIELQRQIAELTTQMTPVAAAEGYGSEAYRALQAEQQELMRQLAKVNGGGQ